MYASKLLEITQNILASHDISGTAGGKYIQVLNLGLTQGDLSIILPEWSETEALGSI